MPPFSTAVSAAGPVVIDLALIAGITAFFIGVIRPLVALKLDPTGTAYDSALQLLTVGSAAGLIYLAEYAPSVFAVVASAVAVSAGAIGGVRVVKGSARPPAMLQGLSAIKPAADPVPVDPAEPPPA